MIDDGRYILVDGEPVKEPDLMTWAKWYESSQDRHLLKSTIGDVDISTVFLGLDHAHDGGPPLLWETMIFGGDHDQWCERYSTRDEAIAGHARACELVRGDA